MRRSPLLAAGLSAVLFALAPSTPADAQSEPSSKKALVYCPVGVDATGCGQVASALAGMFAEVDSAYDGSGGTLDLRTADINHYAVFVVPSLADGSELQPYALLRDAAVAARLKSVLMGRIAVWSGTPDQGDANREAKNTLIRNLATWARKSYETGGVTSGVVLQDLSDVVGQRYGWLGGISPITVQTDSSLDVYESVQSVSPAGEEIIKNGDQQLGYANMASFGLHLPADASGMLAGALGGAENRQIVLVTYQGGEATASVKTDKEDYWPGEVVTITGSGWEPGDTVLMVLHEDPLEHENRTITAIADESGAFVDTTFSPELHDLGVKFLVTAVGRPSGRTAQTTFTDGNGAITGTVKSSVSGNPAIGGATVRCIGGCKGTPSATTAADGSYLLQVEFNGNTSVVRLSASAPSYNTVQHNVTVQNSKTLKDDFILTPVATPTTLAVASATGVYGGTTTLSATLTAGDIVATEKEVAFTLNGTAVGTAMTDASGVATLSAVSLAGINAGTYTGGVAASFAGDPGNAASSGTNTLTVNKASQSITFATLGNITYGQVTSVTANATSSAGLTISFTADGSCTASGATLTIVSAGTCTVTASQAGSDNYEPALSVTHTFTIAKAAATVALDALTQTYDGSAKAVTVETNPGGLAVSVTYNGSITAPTDAGTYEVVAAVTNANYEGSASGTLTITKATPTIAWADPEAITYGVALSSTQLNATAAGAGGVTLTGTFAYTPAAGIVLAAGTHPLSVTFTPASGNYVTASKSVQLIVNKASQTIAFTPPTAKTFGDAPFPVSATSTSKLAVAIGVASGPCTISDGEVTIAGAGSCVLTATQGGDANYNAADPVSRTVTIAKAAQTITFGTLTDKTYGDARFTVSATAAPNLTVSFAAAGSCVVSGSTVTITGAGSCAVTASQAGNENYAAAANVERTFKISKASLTVTANDATKIYGNALPSFSAVFDGFVSDDGEADLTGTLAFETPATASSGIGSYGITPKGLSSANYEIAFVAGVLTVTARPATVTVNNASRAYGTANPTFSARFSELVGTDALACDITTTATTATAVGDYPITATCAENANYLVTVAPGTLSITKAALTVTPASVTRTYGGPNPALTGTISGFVLGDGPGILSAQPSYATAATQTSAVGTYAITASGAAAQNYTFTYNEGTLTVAPAPLTVTADDASRLYGQGNPAFTARYDGFVLGEGPAALGGALGFDTKATESSDVGSYDVTPTGLTSANYAVSFVKGTLSVTQAPLTVTAVDQSKPYDGEPFTGFTASYTGLVLGHTESVLGGALAFGGSAVGATDAGTYVIVPSGLTSSNYAISFVNGTLTIGKTLLTVTATAEEKVYDGTTTAVVTLADDRRSGDAITVGYASATFDDTNVGTSKTVTVSGISISGADAGNYMLANSSSTTTAKITPRPVTVTADPQSKVYGAADPALTYTVTAGSLVAGGGFTGALERVAGEDVAASPYAIKQGTLTAGLNYALSFTGSVLTIAKATATLKLGTLSQMYDGSPRAVTATTEPEGLGTITFAYSGSDAAPTDPGTYDVVATLNNPNYAGSATGQLVVNNPVPVLETLSPASAQKDGPGFTLTVTGSGFSPASKVRWNGEPLATKFVSGAKLEATIPKENIATSVTRYVTVINGTPGGGASAEQAFFVTDAAASVLSSSTQTSTNGEAKASAGGTSATASGTGTFTLAVAQYDKNPGGTLTFGAADRYFDVALQPPTDGSVTEVAIKFCNLNGGGDVQWWNGTVWASVSNKSGPDAGCITVTVNGSTSPSLNDLAGAMFAIGLAQNQTITFGALANKTYGDAPFTVSATASSGLPVTFALGAGSVGCTVSEGTVTITSATADEQACIIVASQKGNSSYYAAADVTRKFSIARADQAITFDQLADKTYGDADFPVSAAASSNLAVSFAAAGKCTVAGNMVHIAGAGSCTVTASQAGNGNYNAASEVARSFTIAKANQTITLDLPASNTFGGPAPSVSASASSGLAVTFTFPTSDRCDKVSADGKLNVIDVGVDGGPGVAGACKLTASQAGSDNYNAASVTKSLDVLNKLDAIINNANNTLSWSSTVKDFTIAVLTLKSADATTTFDAARVDPATVYVIGPSGQKVYVSVDSKGQLKASTQDVNVDGKQDVVFYFEKSKVFSAGNVGSTQWPVTFYGNLKTVAGDPKRDGRPMRGADKIQLTQ